MRGLEKTAKLKHGGARKGAGRPKGEGSKMVRVPLGCIQQVKLIIAVYRGEGEGKFNYPVLKKEFAKREKKKNLLLNKKRKENKSVKTITEKELALLSRNERRKVKKDIKKGKLKLA